MKRHINPLIECFILSFVLLVKIVVLLLGMLKEAFADWHIPAILFIVGLISNFIIYSLLKKKYNFEINVFLYGVGFTSCCVAFLGLTEGILNDLFRIGIEENLWSFYLLPFISLYYSYVTLLYKRKNEINRDTLYLMAITAISFAVLIIFEIIECWIPYVGIFPSLFGLYLVYCLIHKKSILNLQAFTWSPFLPLWIVFLYTLIYPITRF